MENAATNLQAFLASLPQERREAMTKLRDTILKNLPAGFEEVVANGMLGYVVPLSFYHNGYHANPGQPLPFVHIASQKNFIAMYHMGMYGSAELQQWFEAEYSKYSKQKLDMGKSCVRFKNPRQIPFELIGQLMQKITPANWISIYEKSIRR